MQHLQPNTTLQGGKYRIERVLGQGGFGITYMAENVYTHKYVAKKCNIANIGNSPQPPVGIEGSCIQCNMDHITLRKLKNVLLMLVAQ